MWEKGRQKIEGEEAEEHRVKPPWAFRLYCVLIGLTSLLDAGLVLHLRTTAQEEQNPVGSWLILEWGQGGLFAVKAVGTIAVLVTLLFLYKIWRPAAYLIAAAVAAFQLLLMTYIFS